METIETTTIKTGQVLRIHQQISEGDKTRTQVFEGTVIKRRGGKTAGASFTIRKKSGNVWIEKIFPIHLPTIEKVELVKAYKKRRAQMTFLRNEKFKKKLKEIYSAETSTPTATQTNTEQHQPNTETETHSA